MILVTIAADFAILFLAFIKLYAWNTGIILIEIIGQIRFRCLQEGLIEQVLFLAKAIKRVRREFILLHKAFLLKFNSAKGLNVLLFDFYLEKIWDQMWIDNLLWDDILWRIKFFFSFTDNKSFVILELLFICFLLQIIYLRITIRLFHAFFVLIRHIFIFKLNYL